MSRRPRLIRPGDPFHLTARGNWRLPVFFSEADRCFYLDCLARHAVTSQVRLLGWCLMDNHVHLLAIPERPDSLAQWLKRPKSQYSFAINRQHRAHGHLWQSRFYSCPVNRDRLWRVLPYIERNPVRARLAANPWRWQWSSAAAHVGTPDAIRWPLLDDSEWNRQWTPASWRAALAGEREDEAEVKEFRQATTLGVPYGPSAFREEWEETAGRPLAIRPPGRPRRPILTLGKEHAADPRIQCATVPVSRRTSPPPA